MAGRFYDATLEEAASRLDAVSQALIWADMAVLSSQPFQKKIAHFTVANAYVLAASALEEFVRTFLRTLIAELHKAGVKKSSLRPSLLAISEFSKFDSLQDVRDYERWWQRKLEILSSVTDNTLVSFSSDYLPLDGRTIKPVHLQTIWSIFGYQGTPFPNPLWKIALLDIAEGRNNVAHGMVDPIDFARTKGVPDTSKKVEHIQNLLTHLAVTTDAYLDGKQYLR